MSEELVRDFSNDLGIRGDGRTVFGMLVPYGEIARVDDGFGPYLETFDKGAFHRVLRGKPQFLQVQLTHNGHWVGRGHAWQDTDAGLCAEMRLDNTEAGREAAFKIRDGQTPGLSIAFQPGQHVTRTHADGTEVVHRKVVKTIYHVALCAQGAYSKALVDSIRSAPERRRGDDRLQYWQQWTERVRRG